MGGALSPEDIMLAFPTTQLEAEAPSRADLPVGPESPTHVSVPGDVTTLASVILGQKAVVRCVLLGAGESVAMLRPGDTVHCRGSTSHWLVVELAGHGELAVHRDDARLVQIERTGPSSYSG
jgi:hypothetical protein